VADDFDPDAALAQNIAPPPGVVGAPQGTAVEGFDPNEDLYGGIGSQVGTALESGASTASFGLSRALENYGGKALGLPDLSFKSQEAREQANPISSTVGGIGAFVTGIGAGGIIPKIGSAVSDGIASKVVSGAVKYGIEGALAGADNETAKLVMNAPDSVGQAAVNIGLSGLIGAGIGSAGGKIGSLWSATKGPEVGAALDSAADAIYGSTPDAAAAKAQMLDLGQGISTPIPNAAKVAEDAYDLDVKLPTGTLLGENLPRNVASNLAERPSIAGVALNRERTAAAKQLAEAAQSTLEDASSDSAATVGAANKSDVIDTLKENYQPIKDEFQALEPEFKKARVSLGNKIPLVDSLLPENNDLVRLDKTSAGVASEALEQIGKINNVNDLKTVRTIVNNNLNSLYRSGQGGSNEARVWQTVKNGLTNLRTTSLQDAVSEGTIKPDVLDRIGAVDAQHAAFKDTMRQLGVEGGLGRPNNIEALFQRFNDLSDESFTNRFFDTGDARNLEFSKTTFPEVFERSRQFKLNQIQEASADHTPGNLGKFSTQKFLSQVRKLSPEAQAAVFSPEDLPKIAKIENVHEAIPGLYNTSKTSYAEAFAKLFSPEGIVQNLTDTAQLAWLKALPHLNEAASLAGGDSAAKLGATVTAANLDKGTNPGAFKTMVDYIRATQKGNTALSSAVNGLLEGAKVVIPTHLIPNQESRDKLQKALDFTSNPVNAINGGADLGHYLPSHATAVGATTAQATQYLNALKPTQPKMSPLDAPPPVDKEAQYKYNRALDIAEQPLLVLQHVKNGTLQAADVQTLHAIYPALHSTMVQKLTNGLIEKSPTMPYAQRVSLSNLIGGTPLDSTMTPQSMQAIIQSSVSQQVQRQQNAQGGSKQKKTSAATLDQLNKVDRLYQTPSEARAEDKRA
jgi:hypothetical protein